jgi:hypothetical protein
MNRGGRTRAIVPLSLKIVETGPSEGFFVRLHHPYAAALESAVPEPDPVTERPRRRIVLAGETPEPARPSVGMSVPNVLQEGSGRLRRRSPSTRPSSGPRVMFRRGSPERGRTAPSEANAGTGRNEIRSRR